MKVRFTMNARRRLGQIMDYHRNQGTPETGKKLIKEIRENAKLLEEHPKMGQKEEQLSYLGRGDKTMASPIPTGSDGRFFITVLSHCPSSSLL